MNDFKEDIKGENLVEYFDKVLPNDQERLDAINKLTNIIRQLGVNITNYDMFVISTNQERGVSYS
jgi:hypothetical protein